MKRFHSSYLILLLGLLSLPVRAHAETRPYIYVHPDQLSVVEILPGPPADDSAQTREELADLHRIEEHRSAAEALQAKADDAEQDIFIFRTVLGPKFTAESLPLTAALSAHVHDEEPLFVSAGKESWARPRPFTLDPGLHPICKLSKSSAYPSGHTTTGYLEAMVLAAMLPERRNEIFARADDYAHNRLVCGVHYASDLDASKRLAYAMIGLMMDNPQFKAEFEAAKKELRQALSLSPR